MQCLDSAQALKRRYLRLGARRADRRELNIAPVMIILSFTLNTAASAASIDESPQQIPHVQSWYCLHFWFHSFGIVQFIDQRKTTFFNYFSSVHFSSRNSCQKIKKSHEPEKIGEVGGDIYDAKMSFSSEGGGGFSFSLKIATGDSSGVLVEDPKGRRTQREAEITLETLRRVSPVDHEKGGFMMAEVSDERAFDVQKCIFLFVKTVG